MLIVLDFCCMVLYMTKERDDCCVYCGDWYQCRDHFIPVSYSSVIRRYRPGDTVKSCNRCNSWLSDKIFPSMEDRSEFLLGRYQKAYAKLLRMPDWSEEEIAELDYTLAALIKSKQYARLIVRAKLANLQLTSIGHNPVALAYTREEMSEAAQIIDVSHSC